MPNPNVITATLSAKTSNHNYTCSVSLIAEPKRHGLGSGYVAPEKTSGSPRGSPSPASLLPAVAAGLGFLPAQAGRPVAALAAVSLAPVRCCRSFLSAAAVFLGHPASLSLVGLSASLAALSAPLSLLASVREAPLRVRLAAGLAPQFRLLGKPGQSFFRSERHAQKEPLTIPRKRKRGSKLTHALKKGGTNCTARNPSIRTVHTAHNNKEAFSLQIRPIIRTE